MICFFVCFFVLLLNSKFSRIPTDRILSKTMSQVVSEDLEDLGYIFAWKNWMRSPFYYVNGDNGYGVLLI